MKKQSKFRKLIQSKKTTTVLLILILTPFIIFGAILIRDTLQTGTPVIGSRNDKQLEHEITKDHLKEIEEGIKEDMILAQEVNLKASTLRVSIMVSQELTGEVMTEVADRVYAKIDEIIPIETYFTNSEDNKQYDLEITIYNDVEDKTSEDFWMWQIIKAGNMEERLSEWISDPRDPEFKQEVLDILAAKKAKEEEDAATENEETETEEKEGGE